MTHPFAWFQQRLIGPKDSLAMAISLAGRLPAGRHLLNLCEDRYLFTLGLMAAALRRQISLLPPARSPALLDDLQARYADTQLLTDTWIQDQVDLSPSEPTQPDETMGFGDLEGLHRQSDSSAENFSAEGGNEAAAAMINSMRLLAFTSGSTGRPQPWARNWEMLRRCAMLALDALNLQHRSWAVIATTPPQHMYGLETSVIWPLCSELVLAGARPFYPEDIRRTVAQSPLPVLLVSTPVHLKACLDSPGPWHNLAAILSSTAPLNQELASELERATGIAVVELYGSTETLSFAWRRPAKEQSWKPYPGVELACQGDHTVLTAPWLAGPVMLSDRFEPARGGLFNALGRHSDLVKIAGKRQSLTELNQLLLSIDGVADGCFFPTGHGRVGALVVSQCSRETIRRQLRQRIDEVFLPRPLYFVTHIPRNATGKIVQRELQSLLKSLTCQR